MFENYSTENINQFIKDFLKSERAILLLCMSIALVFWLIVQLSQLHKTTVFVPLTIQTPKGLILKNEPPKSLKITLSSKGWSLFSGNYRKQLKQLKLSIRRDQKYNYQQLQQIIKSKISDKIKITSVYPNSISFELDQFIKKKVPVKANESVETVNQFQLSNKIQLLPDTVEIYGPKSLISSISFVNTKEIKAKELRENRYGQVDLLLQKNKQVKYQLATVNYMMTVEQFSEKTLTVSINVEDDTTNTVRLIPQTGTVTCTVGLTKYDKLKPTDIQLSVNVYNVDLEKVTKLPVVLKKKPNWINNVKINPEFVDFVLVTTTENMTEDEKK